MVPCLPFLCAVGKFCKYPFKIETEMYFVQPVLLSQMFLKWLSSFYYLWSMTFGCQSSERLNVPALLVVGFSRTIGALDVIKFWNLWSLEVDKSSPLLLLQSIFQLYILRLTWQLYMLVWKFLIWCLVRCLNLNFTVASFCHFKEWLLISGIFGLRINKRWWSVKTL